ncbi:hypothetical protein [Actinomadura parmotrematis]|uniref:Uncharacterized protein n=1 Tax=Actinomadura parmotrematis TaxID=2864039 RepID=A0ABS7G1T0_9ACTN|nr:hypothetical protein [Actinomadura parmotrematis]MBW8486658.1 hypothetical protein [Actinomadura parmotrematis]
MDLDGLLPPPALARCALTMEVGTQIDLAIRDAGLANVDVEHYTAQVIRARDRALENRLLELLPYEEIERSTNERGIDVADLYGRLPYIHAIWVLGCAQAALQATNAIVRASNARTADAAAGG